MTLNFPYLKDINEFDFSFQTFIDKSKIMDLMTLRFIEKWEHDFKTIYGQNTRDIPDILTAYCFQVRNMQW